MNLPFPAVPAEEGPSTPGIAVVPRVLHAALSYRRLADGKAGREWLRRVTAHRQLLVLRSGAGSHLLASPPDESIELARRRQALATQSAVEQRANLPGAQAKAQSFFATEQHRLDKLREKKLGLRRKNVEQFRRSLQRDDLVASVTGLEVAILDALDWTREPALMRLFTQACEVPADWFDWKREELETRMISRRFAHNAAEPPAGNESKADEAPLSAEEVLSLWSGPRSPIMPEEAQPASLPVAHEASVRGVANAKRVETPLSLPEVLVPVPAVPEQEEAPEYVGSPAEIETRPVVTTSVGRGRGEFSFAPTYESTTRSTDGDFESSATARPTFVSDQSIERLMLSVAPNERPILDALIAMIASAARDGRLTTDHALSMLTRVAAL